MRCALLFAVVTVLSASQLSGAPPVRGDWTRVEQAIADDQPKTAAAELKLILNSAIENQRYAEAIKALCRQIQLEFDPTGDHAERRISELDRVLPKMPAPMQPILHIVVANWYADSRMWHELQDPWQRSRLDRDAGGSKPDDITQWSAEQLIEAMSDHIDRALQDAERLQRIPISQYAAVLQTGSLPYAYRPTLYDVVMHQAIECYLEQGTSLGFFTSHNERRLVNYPAALASNREFLAWKPASELQASPFQKALRAYQLLLKFHQDDRDRSAWLDAELNRILFAGRWLTSPNIETRFSEALERFAKQYSDHPIVVRAIYEQAAMHYNSGDFAKARESALRGKNLFPGSVGNQWCRALIRRVEEKELDVKVSRLQHSKRPTIHITYRNVGHIYLRVVPLTYDECRRDDTFDTDLIRKLRRRELLEREPFHEWTVKLPATKEYRRRSHEITIPVDLPSGPYVVLAGLREDLRKRKSLAVAGYFWRTNLAIVSLSRRNGVREYMLVDAETGDPIVGAQVSVDRLQKGDSPRVSKRIGRRTTDRLGRFTIAEPHGSQTLFDITYGDDRMLHSTSGWRVSKTEDVRQGQRIKIYTDRAVYRPGQEIRYKGIFFAYDLDDGEHQVRPGTLVTVVFTDALGQELARRSHHTNRYGSFHGSFRAPSRRLLGRMSIRTLFDPFGFDPFGSEPLGSASFRVEEYKRAKIQVELERYRGAAQVGEPVTVTGRAVSYTSAALDNAVVRWRVSRDLSVPSEWIDEDSRYDQVLAWERRRISGQVGTDAQGRYSITFPTSLPFDLPADVPVTISFRIDVDLVDASGEAATATRRVEIGRPGLSVDIDLDRYPTVQRPISCSIAVSTLNGVSPGEVNGTLSVYEIVQPKTIAESIEPIELWQDYHAPSWNAPGFPDTKRWPNGRRVVTVPVKTDSEGKASAELSLAAGLFRVEYEMQGAGGNVVRETRSLIVLDPLAQEFPVRLPIYLAAERETVRVGETLAVVWGSGFESARAFVEIEQRGRILQQFWTDPDRTQQQFRFQITNALRGGFVLRVWVVRNGRLYPLETSIEVPELDDRFVLKWQHFVSRLTPAKRETWTLKVSSKGKAGSAIDAEIMATMFDSSLERIDSLVWDPPVADISGARSRTTLSFSNYTLQSRRMAGRKSPKRKRQVYLTYPSLLSSIVLRSSGSRVRPKLSDPFYSWSGMFPGMSGGIGGTVSDFDSLVSAIATHSSVPYVTSIELSSPAGGQLTTSLVVSSTLAAEKNEERRAGAAGLPLDTVSVRRDLNEAAFFFPELHTESDGTVRITFTPPETLTTWRFMALAHDRRLRHGMIEASAVTRKDLMVRPNPPRFLREGDRVLFPVTVINLSKAKQVGRVRLEWSDLRTERSLDAEIGNGDNERSFELAAGASHTFLFPISVATTSRLLVYRVTAATETYSDGEESILPVLPRKLLVHDSKLIPIAGSGVRKVEWKSLTESGASPTIEHESLTVQVVSQPIWHAVMALPYLIEYPHECSEQLFNRLYATSVGRMIVESQPRVRRVIESWRDTDALASPLEKNNDLRGVSLEETPWLRDAHAESQARRRVVQLLDTNRLKAETRMLLARLSRRRAAGGGWSWFPGDKVDSYITTYILAGFGRLNRLGIDVDPPDEREAVELLDTWVLRDYHAWRAADDGGRRSRSRIRNLAFGLYARSFYLEHRPLNGKEFPRDELLDFVEQHWKEARSYQSRAHFALALHRLGRAEGARKIMHSLKERATYDEKFGMHWEVGERSWQWADAPIETQALMIEAFTEIMADEETVERCRRWLILHQRSNRWPTTKGTADACYALLLGGTSQLAANEFVSVALGDASIESRDAEPGTGFVERRFGSQEIRAEMGRIRVEKKEPGEAWVALHWQYRQDVSQLRSTAAEEPLSVKKELFRVRVEQGRDIVEPVQGKLEVGDRILVRLTLRADRDMEYIHVKDQRGSGMEPASTKSGYSYSGGIGSYRAIRDTSMHFFVRSLPKGIHVLEYTVRLQHRGRFETGLAEAECMYAPEFRGRSRSIAIVCEEHANRP